MGRELAAAREERAAPQPTITREGKVQVQWLFVSCRGSRSPNSPFALSRLANLTHAVAARLRLSVPTWQHVHRRVLRELGIEFELSRHLTRQFRRSLQLSWKVHPPQAE